MISKASMVATGHLRARVRRVCGYGEPEQCVQELPYRTHLRVAPPRDLSKFKRPLVALRWWHSSGPRHPARRSAAPRARKVTATARAAREPLRPESTAAAPLRSCRRCASSDIAARSAALRRRRRRCGRPARRPCGQHTRQDGRLGSEGADGGRKIVREACGRRQRAGAHKNRSVCEDGRRCGEERQ